MTVTSDTRKPYSGNTRSLVLAFDVGTTFSGVSYAILEPNEIPKIHGVTRCILSLLPLNLLPLSWFIRYPGQEHVAGSYKIPTLMFYDQDGNMKVAGAEADSNAIIDLAEDEGWTKTELLVPYRLVRLSYSSMFLLQIQTSASASEHETQNERDAAAVSPERQIRCGSFRGLPWLSLPVYKKFYH